MNKLSTLNIKKIKLKNSFLEAGEMAWRLRVYSALPEDPDLDPSTNIEAKTITPVPGVSMPSSGLGHFTQNIHEGKTLKHIK